MIKSLSISNYKNLSGLTIDRFSLVNLISGKNNVGKSSLLEAIELHINDKQILPILYRRGELDIERYHPQASAGYIKDNLTALSSLFTHRNQSQINNTIEINDGNYTVAIRLATYYERESEENGDITKRYIILKPGEPVDEEIHLGLLITRPDSRLLVPLNRKLTDNNLLRNRRNDIKPSVSITAHSDLSVYNATRWDEVTLTDKEPYVIEALQIIDPAIESLAYLQSSDKVRRYPVVKLRGQNGRVPLQGMGDGINRILAIILAIVNAEGGCAIIDEIDNGLHYTVQKQLWEIIFKVARRLDVQVFATTHSSDCISSFGKILNETDNSEYGRYIRIENNDGQIRQVQYNANELSVVAAQNIEIR